MKNPYRLYNVFAMRGWFNKTPDHKYIAKRYSAHFGRRLNLENPKTFNEKLQWLKLYYRKPELTTLVDKYKVRDYIAKTLGEDYLIPLLGAWDSPNQIDFDQLPNQFVLKCNHNSGLGMCICKDKSSLDLASVRQGLEKGLAQNYYLAGREWPYKNVERKVICEKFMNDSSGGLIDYKFFCFNGTVDCVMLCLDRHLGDTKFYFFDRNWKLKRLNVRGKNAPKDFTLRKPACMDEMFRIAEQLSVGHPFVRVDLYECNERIYFGEMTFFPDSGFDENLLPETDEYFGNLINLDTVRKEMPNK